MSQHHLTITAADGRQAHLIAGWDWPLLCFFLELIDLRVVREELDPDSMSDKTFDEANLLSYDSTGRGGFRSMAAVEHKLEELLIPLGDDDWLKLNPLLLDLLAELLNEKDSPRPPQGDRKLKFWDKEPGAVVHSAAHLTAVADFYAQANQSYSLQQPHPVYSEVNWHRYCQEMEVRLLMPYDRWVTHMLHDINAKRLAAAATA